MELDNKNKQYNKYIDSYIKDYDAYEGQEVIKKKGEKYLPKLAGQKVDAKYGDYLYELFKESALWFPATGSTVRGYLGIMFRKTPIAELPKSIEWVKSGFADDGSTIDAVAKNLAREVILRYRPALLVDFPSTDTSGMSIKDVEDMNLRPYVAMYDSTQIVNWHERVGQGVKKLDYCQLKEMHDVMGFKYNNEISLLMDRIVVVDGQYELMRVLDLIEYDGQPEVYRQQVYIKAKNKKKDGTEYLLIYEDIPIKNGSYFNYIPIVPCSEDGTQWDLEYSLINDLVNLNIADYNNEALYRDNLRFLARPTICMKGRLVEEGANKGTVSIGSSQIVEFETDGDSWLLGGDASQASALVESAKGLKSQMSTVGLRSLASDPNGVESAETASIHRSGEHGTLTNVANAVSDCITKALEIVLDWMGGEGDVSYEVQTDFIPTKIDPATLRTLWEMYTNGDFPLSQLIYNLKNGEVLETTVSEDDFEEAKKNKVDIAPPEPIIVKEPVEDEILEYN